MKKTLIMILIGAVVGCLIGTGGTLVVQKLFLNKAAASEKPAAAPHKDGPVVSVGEFTVNLQGGSYLKTTIAVEGNTTKSEEVLKTKESFLKDRINTVLANKSLEDIKLPAAREKLRGELLEQLNEVAEDQIHNVLFVTFVYQ